MEHLQTLNKIKSKEKVLEIGSGFGVFLELLSKKQVISEGLELNPEAILVCNNKGLKVHDTLIQEFVLENDDKFDVVCSFQVLEHITEVYSFIENSIKALKCNGKLVFGVPNNRGFLTGILILSGLILLTGFIRSIKFYQKQLINNFFYFILYLCTLEIGPYILICKLFSYDIN